MSYTNPSNIIKTVLQMLGNNLPAINRIVQEYEDDRVLNLFEGKRKTLPREAFPSLEIEPTSTSVQWYTTRAQMSRYSFIFTLTVVNDNEDFGVEYPSAISTILVELLTDPVNLQMTVLNEKKWDSGAGLVETRILDSLVEDVTHNASKDGSIRTVEFSWFASVLEPYPESKWRLGGLDKPTLTRYSPVELTQQPP